MPLDLVHIDEVSQALRGLCLGRVYLKVDAEVGDTILQVGVVGSSPGLAIPGAQFFHRSGSLSVKLVQPRANALAGSAGIEHSETLTAVKPTGNPLHLTVSSAITKAYTVARGAYVELVSRPTVCGDLKIISKDFTEADAEPEDKYFPGVFVVWDETQFPTNTTSQYNETLAFVVRYAGLEQDGVDNRAELISAAGQLVNNIEEDNYLGGTVHQSKVVGLSPSWSARSRMANRGAYITQQQRRIIWVDILVEASRVVVWDKITP